MKTNGRCLLMLCSLLTACLLTGCQQLGTPKPYALNQQTLIDLPKLNNAPVVTSQQLLHARSAAMPAPFSPITLQVLLEITPERLNLALFNTLGVPILTLQFDDQSLHSKQYVPLPNEAFSASQMLGDIMMAYLPLSNWQAVLPKGWQLQESPQQRRLLNNRNTPIMTIDYTDSTKQIPQRLTHHLFAYSITLTDLTLAP